MCDNCSLYNQEKGHCNWVLNHASIPGCCMLKDQCLKVLDAKLNCVICHEYLEYAKSVVKNNIFNPTQAAYYQGKTKRKNPHGINQKIWDLAITQIGLTLS